MASTSPASRTSSPGSDSEAQKRRREDDGGNMLENLYGVERRSERPQKQIKVVKNEGESETESKPSKSTFDHHSNGTISKFMKDQKDGDTKPVDSLIDLTNGMLLSRTRLYFSG